MSLKCTQFSLEQRNSKPNFPLCEAPCPKTRPDPETAVLVLSWNDSLAVSHGYKSSIGSQNSVNISIAFFKLLITGPFHSCQTWGACSEKWFVTQIVRPSWPAPGKESGHRPKGRHLGLDASHLMSGQVESLVTLGYSSHISGKRHSNGDMLLSLVSLERAELLTQGSVTGLRWGGGTWARP